ncbi:MAG TPA: diacylglycerol kinase [Rickettsiales bacterium]|nr:diacylglycerol kinase [Rickettsiales bacterium]
MKTNKTGLARILEAFKYSKDGFVSAFKTEEAFREDILLCAVLFIISILLPISFIEKLFLFSSLFLVILCELINTAIETIIDRISEKIHPLSKVAKDIGSCIVLISFVYLILVWFIILYENFL